ncbi:tetratricopeptide repeat protein [Shimia sp.]|uniref:tetratricopeptide repeat protein n=1 Tax=Shimia sp. TaxID=1954381 RepID=UPI003B8D3B30
MKICRSIALACALLMPVVALGCPTVQTDHAIQDQLYSELKAAPNEMIGRGIEAQIWETWISAPDENAQALMDQGRERIRVADCARAEELFSDLIEYCPHNAEGWNQRAYVRFLRQDYGDALEDVSIALEYEPRHFGALAGRATTLLSMGRVEVGYVVLREALKINPWLRERHLVPLDQDI